MKKCWIVSLVYVSLGGSAYADLSTAQFEFAFNMRDDPQSANHQGSFFYLNDNLSNTGNVLAGQIGWGAWEIDRSGNRVNALQTNLTLTAGNSGEFFYDPNAVNPSPPIGAKSLVRIGSFNYLASNNSAGVGRFLTVSANAWTPAGIEPQLQTPSEIGFATESITSVATVINNTPTTLMITNETDGVAGTGRVHAFEVRGGPLGFGFTLNPIWSTDIETDIAPGQLVNPDPGFRGIANGGNGFAYAVDTGNGGAGSVWAFDVTNGSATKVTDYIDSAGTGDSFLIGRAGIAEPIQGFGAIVHQDELWVTGTGGFVSSFELTTPTTVGARTDIDFGQMLFDSGAAESSEVAIFGIAADGDGPGGEDDFLWISYEARGESPNRRIAGFSIPGDNNPGIGILPGDVNLDGAVTFEDFLILQNHFEEPGNWEDGDFNIDGWVDFEDFLILQNQWELPESQTRVFTQGIDPIATPIPEPMSLTGLVLLGLIGSTRRGSFSRSFSE